MNQEMSTQLNAPTRRFGVSLSPTPRGARLARLLATEWLRAWDLPPGSIDTAAHLVAELAANAATHGRLPGRDFRLALHATSAVLRIEVTDTRGDDLPRRQPPPPDAVSGRGLLLVEALADRWGVELGPVPRKTVWAELNLLPLESPAAPKHGGPCSGAAGALF
ncbi:ATP-binding protein [Streptomyces sp. NPDC005485]|uniref:ATP-binding protein n=1 Tax=Streptomyces sp. NPDC005485 TaxID=3155591 RepID=UPI0033A85477